MSAGARIALGFAVLSLIASLCVCASLVPVGQDADPRDSCILDLPNGWGSIRIRRMGGEVGRRYVQVARNDITTDWQPLPTDMGEELDYEVGYYIENATGTVWLSLIESEAAEKPREAVVNLINGTTLIVIRRGRTFAAPIPEGYYSAAVYGEGSEIEVRVSNSQLAEPTGEFGLVNRVALGTIRRARFYPEETPPGK